MNKYKLITSLLLVVLITAITTFFITDHINHKGMIVIKNKSNETLTNVTIIYQSVGKKYFIPDIPPNNTYKYQIDYLNHNEQSTYITYNQSGKYYEVLGSDYHADYWKKPYKIIIK